MAFLMRIISAPEIDCELQKYGVGELPEFTGEHRFDFLARLADYLAGTLADMAPDITFSKEKCASILGSVLLNAKNHWYISPQTKHASTLAQASYKRLERYNLIQKRLSRGEP